MTGNSLAGWVPKALTALLLCMATLLLTSGVAEAGGKAKLVVASGKVKAKKGNLKGSFAIRNVGGAKSAKTTAKLKVKTPGKDPVAGRYAVRPLAPGGTAKAKVKVPIPSGLPSGKSRIVLCVQKDCAKLGKVKGSGGGGGGGGGSSVPNNPINYPTDEPFELTSSASKYWVVVPSSYDGSHQTPTTLFVWSHGCGGDSGGDIFNISPGGNAQSWISVSVGGRDGDCWDPNGDQDKVMKAISNMKTHFNINPRTVVLGGYSSGGDLSYRTAFEHSNQIAGVLAENTSPFRDTGLTQDQAISAASSKFHVVHLAHLQDDAYPIATVRSETDALSAAGFPVERIERTGTHFDNPGDVVAGTPVPGTDADVVTFLLPHLNDGWTSPG